MALRARADAPASRHTRPAVDMATAISCPGKVLLAGGYLVLDPHHQGFVVSTPSRFYTVVQPVPVTTGNDNKIEQDEFHISVKSPQFDDGAWEYKARKRDGEWTVEEVKQEV